ncbi:TIGR00297 family protein [Geoglobus acetivorans]|uniref:TIGR00297 family protein n=1 Tax=Geoglobus acetivorans TaxID=565033 RepID=UPI00130EA5C9
MDIALALLAYLYPKLDVVGITGLAIALLIYRASKIRKIELRGNFEEDSFFAILLFMFLTLSVHFNLIPAYTAVPAIFVSSLRVRMPYYLSIPVYFAMSTVFLSYFPNPWNFTLILLISLTVSLATTLIMHAAENTSYSIPLILTNLSVLIAFEIYRIDVSEVELITGFLLAFVLSMIAYRAGVADETGLMAATITGMLIIVSASLKFFVILLLFYAVGSAATKYRYKEKERLGIGEPAGGARGYVNVFANSFPALFFSLNYGYMDERVFALAFTASLATALGDTMASEIGKMAERVYLITTFERITPGESGGVSVRGEIAALTGAALISLSASLLGILTFQEALISMVAGFVGVHVDSVLGATLEKKGMLNNAGVNLFATLSAGLLCLLTVL